MSGPETERLAAGIRIWEHHIMKIRSTIGVICISSAALCCADPVKPERKGRDEGGSQMRDVFGQMLRGLDADKDGAISFVEFSAGEKLVRHTEEQRKKLFDRLDKNHDGSIQRNEIPRGGGMRERRHLPFDPSGDGKVSFEEFQKNPPLADLPLERKQEIFKKMDRNDDGFLDRKDGRPGGPGRRPHHGKMPPFGKLDEDKDGSVSFEEFRKSPRVKDQNEEEQEDAFEKLDRNGNGAIEKDEFPRGLRPGAPPQGPHGKKKPTV